MIERKAYRAREVAEILDIDINSVYDMVREGILPSIRIGETGKGIRIPKKYVDALLEGGVQNKQDSNTLVAD